MEVSANSIFKNAIELLREGNDLNKVCDDLNLLFDHTIKQKTNEDVLLFHLGATFMKKGYKALALLLFKEALKYRPKFPEALNNIGYIYKGELFHEEAKACFHEALALNEQYAHLYEQTKEKDIWALQKAEYLTNIGSMYIANGTPLKALDYFNRALDIAPDVAFAKWNRSLASLEAGDYEKGFHDYEYGERTERTKNRDYGIKDLPFWDGTPGKTVVIYGEQGLGDELMFASMLPDALKDCTVILDAHPRLADLFRLNFPGVPVYGTRKAQCAWTQYHDIDAKLQIASLGKFYRKKPEDFPRKPYLKANPILVEKYREKLEAMGDKPKIGISWQGGTDLTGREHRTIPLEKWLPIFRLDCDFISLQYDKNNDEEVKRFELLHGINLNHWRDMIDDYDETAGLVSNLDLIISVPQSVVHLAGALGAPTWQLCPFKAMWQCGVHGQDMPWYGSVRNFWQDANCEWNPVLEEVKGELCNLLQKSIAS